MSTATQSRIDTDHQLTEHATPADDFVGMEEAIAAGRAERQGELIKSLTEAGLASPEATPAEQEIGEAAASAAVKVDNV